MTAPSQILSMLQYSSVDKHAFHKYFKPAEPKKRRRGRPKSKKKTGRPKKKGKKPQDQTRLSTTGHEHLESQLLGQVSKSRRKPQTRTNWEQAEHFAFRERCRVSWETRTDLYAEGESFVNFTRKVGINRHVLLLRYMDRVIKTGTDAAKRGRKTFLLEDVMRHLCEGKFFIFYKLLYSHNYNGSTD